MQMRRRALTVGVRMCVEGAAAPPYEEPDGETGDQEPDRGLGAALDCLRQVCAIEDDRHTEREERQGVAGSPREAEPGRVSGAPLGRGEESRDRSDVVRIGGVAEAEQDR